MIVPIIKNNDFSNIVGYVNIENHKLKFTFINYVHREIVHEVFTNITYIITDFKIVDNEELIKSGEIVSFMYEGSDI